MIVDACLIELLITSTAKPWCFYDIHTNRLGGTSPHVTVLAAGGKARRRSLFHELSVRHTTTKVTCH